MAGAASLPGPTCPAPRAERPACTDAPAAAWLQEPARDPDALYANRENVANARAAAEIWDARLRASGARPDFEAAWKLARATYWVGSHENTAEAGRAALERGMAAARAAIRAQPDRPEGHFWLAATMGQLAESFGLRMGLRYRKDIKRELETVLQIDPAFQQGSADRALGRWYFKVPGLFGGSNKRSEAHLRQSLTYDPNSQASLYFLAETLHDMGQDADARAALQRLLAAPLHTGWEPEDREFKAKGQRLLRELH